MLLTENILEVISHECKTTSKLESNVVIAAGSQISLAGQSYGDSWSLLWLPIDLILEDALGGGNVAAFSAIEIITGMIIISFNHNVETPPHNRKSTLKKPNVVW